MPSLMGVDFGQTRTGVALAEWEVYGDKSRCFSLPPSIKAPPILRPHTINAIRYLPLATIKSLRRNSLITDLSLLIQQWQPCLLIIGVLPDHDDGSPRNITLMARKLGRQLHAHMNIPTTLYDETLTSATADQGDDITGRIPLDQAAAIEILRGFINHIHHLE